MIDVTIRIEKAAMGRVLDHTMSRGVVFNAWILEAIAQKIQRERDLEPTDKRGTKALGV